MCLRIIALVILVTVGFLQGKGFCLEPEEILVVANRRMAKSIDIAKYYMDNRSIPESHLLKLSLTLKETMTRKEYDDVLKKQVLDAINKLKPEDTIAAIVLIYGVPLKVAPPLPDSDEMEKINRYRKEKKALDSDNLQAKKTNNNKEKKNLTEKINELLRTNTRAAVDSELALVKAGQYSLDRWIQNPYFLGFSKSTLPLNKDQVLLVCRLDGPDPATVYRIINDTLQVERAGLDGKAYFDARWPSSRKKELLGYKFYDNSIHRAAAEVGKRMEVVLDDKDELFAKNSCPKAALYCGWYSLGRYIDSFAWQQGAIGYHIASAECSSLKNIKRPLWCLKMLEKGIAATIGPVYEPYVQGFPLPEIFFSLLVEGYMSLGESYLVSLPYLSWQMVLVGDPLYQPFAPAE
jgi:uncharacterized protein (TIGR03790 family)